MLLKNIRRPIQYHVGGVSQSIAFPTFLPNGLPALTAVLDAVTGKITGLTLAPTVVPVILEFEENEGLFSDDVKIGVNRFPEPTVGYKFSGRDDDRNETMKAFDLTKTTHIVKLRTGNVVIVGYKNGLQSTQSKSGSGAKREDFAGYDIVLAGGETARCPDVPESVWETLLALVVTV